MLETPRGFWLEESNRIAAIKWLVEVKLGGTKGLADVAIVDFQKHRLGGLLTEYYSKKASLAIAAAYPDATS